jgi:hypothetical protein
MSSINEWDKLNKVIVGIADGAKIPEIDDSMRCVNYAGTKALDEVIVGPYPEQVIREANRDLDNLAHHLTNSGIEVLRPEKRILHTTTTAQEMLFLHTVIGH